MKQDRKIGGVERRRIARKGVTETGILRISEPVHLRIKGYLFEAVSHEDNSVTYHTLSTGGAIFRTYDLKTKVVSSNRFFFFGDELREWRGQDTKECCDTNPTSWARRVYNSLPTIKTRVRIDGYLHTFLPEHQNACLKDVLDNYERQDVFQTEETRAANQLVARLYADLCEMQNLLEKKDTSGLKRKISASKDRCGKRFKSTIAKKPVETMPTQEEVDQDIKTMIYEMGQSHFDQIPDAQWAEIMTQFGQSQ